MGSGHPDKGPSETSGNFAQTILGVAPSGPIPIGVPDGATEPLASASKPAPKPAPQAAPKPPRKAAPKAAVPHRKPSTSATQGPGMPVAAAPDKRVDRSATALTIAPVMDVRGPATVIPERTRIVPGRQLPGTPFTVIRLVGEGGMGSVYEAEHRDIGRHVALKILHPEQCLNPTVVQMFRDEARAATRIGSKYIVEVLDFDELSDGRVMIVMELLDAVTLDDALQEGPVEISRMIGILRQACKGIGAAHNANIVHRDIKPENIMLCHRDGRDDVVKLVDFGISTIRQETNGEGKVVGTPEFVSPEQAAGMAVDGRSDMYSLACTAYTAFAGRPPFKGETLFDLLTQHLTAEPEPLSTWRADHGCPPALEAVLRKALAKDPKDRFKDMADFEAAICEAQIAAKITTPWDDLELPDVDLPRRERLLREMPGRLGAPMARRTRFVVGATLIAALSATTAWYFTRTEPGMVQVEGDDTVQVIVNDARAAAARASYVYPPVDDPDFKTAYRWILELEALPGDDRDPGQRQAAGLRHEFADALVRVGDWLYAREGGATFAADYYMQALMFDPESDRRDRVFVTAGELAELRRKASLGGFSRAELEAAEPLAEMKVAMDVAAPTSAAPAEAAGNAAADPDAEEEKKQAYRRMLRSKRRALAVREAELDKAIVKAGGQVDVLAEVPRSEGSPPARDPDAVADEVAAALAEAEAEAATPVAPIGDKRGERADESSRKDPTKVNDLLQRANDALRAGQRPRALKLFSQVVDLDGDNAKALIALSDLNFDAGNYHNAVRFGERAVQAAPRNAGYRLKLGDAYYKRLMFTEARSQYRRAEEFGHPDAARKLAKVEEKLGG